MKSNAVLMLLVVHEKHEMREKGRCWTSGWTGFVTPSETFQNTYRYAKRYGTGNIPVPAFVFGRIATKPLEQAS